MTKFITKTIISIAMAVFLLLCIAFLALMAACIYYSQQNMFNVTAVAFEYAAYAGVAAVVVAMGTLYAQRRLDSRASENPFTHAEASA